MAFVFMDNQCVSLTNAVDRSARTLPIGVSDRQKLDRYIKTQDDYTYLTLTSARGSEIVKVYKLNGIYYMDRGLGGTEPISAPVGACLCFQYNKLILDEYVDSIQEPCRVTITSQDLLVTPPTGDNCNWRINFTEDFKDRLDICCPEGDCPQCNVVDGTYENATITVRNGRLCAITNGRNIVYTGGSCCNCGTEQ